MFRQDGMPRSLQAKDGHSVWISAWLIKLKPLLKAGTKVLIAGMVKALPRSVWPMLERLLGATDTAAALKKASGDMRRK